ncbi:MAG: hypothetical protein ACJAUG_000877 [Halioglobus sp.]|jgi:hypothetical protein
MNLRIATLAIASGFFCSNVSALSMAAEEFLASRAMACVLAEQALGQINDDEYGARWHTVLDGFEEPERTTILAKALGYYDGLMFDIAESDTGQINRRLEVFVTSKSCQGSYQKVGFQL